MERKEKRGKEQNLCEIKAIGLDLNTYLVQYLVSATSQARVGSSTSRMCFRQRRFEVQAIKILEFCINGKASNNISS